MTAPCKTIEGMEALSFFLMALVDHVLPTRVFFGTKEERFIEFM